MTSATRFLRVTNRIEAGEVTTQSDFEECFGVIHRFEDFTQKLLLEGMPNPADFKTLTKRLEECAVYRIKLISQLAKNYHGNFNQNND